jgi:DNA-binding XRE family transcriptional regulator
MTIKNKLTTLREKSGFSQAEVARKSAFRSQHIGLGRKGMLNLRRKVLKNWQHCMT